MHWSIAEGTPLGTLWVVASARGVHRVIFGENGEREWARVQAAHPEMERREDGLSAQALAQIIEYLRGARRTFTVPLDPEGTPFQQRVWKEAARIPYGQTLTYRELARRIGQPQAARAVGQALGANPLPILIPCHRVIAADGRLGGYTGGRHLKQWLLLLEGAPLAA
ncbi:MAG: methylated-DNA--[protein]-cysteine S-methyltransferase [Thermoflexus sp.]|uniref:methylated-DNA--[protein]-cysteine S-methyltransferase n=1 Tax=Thermoflexus sp. TaxID=1969742 RepID=UPI0025EBC59C|nr:methylated-DNA--[protein]-cysteine S-methyltransferase [Thermoflexus sp.]MCS6963496.1 methylated-DNA--[protein]-cysteine S-methyltransferase [Thermoflexus sp.]